MSPRRLGDAKTPPTAFEIEVDRLSKQITMVIIAMVAAVAALLLLRHSMGVAEIAIFLAESGSGRDSGKPAGCVVVRVDGRRATDGPPPRVGAPSFGRGIARFG